jgi:hypothetical protein
MQFLPGRYVRRHDQVAQAQRLGDRRLRPDIGDFGAGCAAAPAIRPQGRQNIRLRRYCGPAECGISPTVTNYNSNAATRGLKISTRVLRLRAAAGRQKSFCLNLECSGRSANNRQCNQ